jgi:phosphoserine phosphatase
VAVFVFDDVAAAHHAGEVAFLRLVERAEFRFTDAWWQRIPIEFRDRARRAHKRFSSRPEAVWPRDEDFSQWRKLMFESYDLLCRRDGRRACKSWLTALLMGHTESEAEAYMRETLEEALRDPFAAELIRADAGDEQTVPAVRGIRRVPAMQELIEELLAAGFDVWALSSSNQWITEAMATRYGIDPSRVVGLRPRVLNKRLQTEIVDPVPVGAGAAEAVVLFIGRHPDLVVAPPDDAELLEHGKGLRVAMDRGDERFKARAAHRGWLLQAELPRAEAEAQ